MALIRSFFVSRNLNLFITQSRLFQRSCNKYATNELEDTGPIKFTKSPASKWRAEVSRTGVDVPRLWYEPFVLLGSITIFLLYFCVFRQENDIDRELEESLYKRINGLEEKQLYVVLQYNEEQGLETKDIIDRLKVLEEEKK